MERAASQIEGAGMGAEWPFQKLRPLLAKLGLILESLGELNEKF